MWDINEFNGSYCCLEAASFNLCKVGIKSDGKVGIGTNSPSGLMHLYGSSPQLYFTDSDTNVESFFDHDSSSGNFALNIDPNDNAPGDNSKFIVRFHATGGAAGGDKFSVDQSGNVGINTTNITGSDALTNNTAVLAVGIVTTNSLFSSELKVADNIHPNQTTKNKIPILETI